MEAHDTFTASATISWPALSLSDIEHLVSRKCPAGIDVGAVEDHDGVIVTLTDTGRRQTGFMVTRLQLNCAINPHSMLETYTHEALEQLCT